jgi:cytochrome c oxidase subunit 4
MSDSHVEHVEHIRKQVRAYVAVFATLMALTIITVAVSYLHLSLGPALFVALIVATVKAGLVASYFMHLISERKAIYGVLILTVVFFVALIFLPLLGFYDPIELP